MITNFYENLSISLTEDYNRLLKKAEKINSELDSNHIIVKSQIFPLKWMLRRHFYLIEKNLLQFSQTQWNSEIMNCIAFHKKIMHEFLKIHSLWKKKEPINSSITTTLIEIIKNNLDYEKEKIYPILEQILTPDKKKEIYKKLQMHVSQGYYPLSLLRDYWK